MPTISTPITALPSGQLHRAIVSLPPRLCPDRRLQERIVFFEVQLGHHPGTYLERLLAITWCVNTRGWLDDGLIYNFDSARERLAGGSYGSEATGELRLLEVGCGGGFSSGAVGPEFIHYARARDVDLFVSPRVAARLRALLDDVEALYRAAEPSQRGGG